MEIVVNCCLHPGGSLEYIACQTTMQLDHPGHSCSDVSVTAHECELCSAPAASAKEGSSPPSTSVIQYCDLTNIGTHLCHRHGVAATSCDAWLVLGAETHVM